MPATTLAARFSLPHIAAITLILGHASTACFATTTLSDPAIAALRDKVRVLPFDMGKSLGHHWPAAVAIKAAGKVYQATHVTARGGHGEPYSEEEILKKIDILTCKPYPSFGSVFREALALVPARLDSRCSELIAQACRA